MPTRAVVLCLTVSLAAGVVTACGGREASGEPDFKRSEVRSLVLAPADLGRGYTYGDDSFCGGFSPESMSKKFTDFVRETDRGLRHGAVLRLAQRESDGTRASCE